jgi:Mg-chelatase subunit ChlD
MHESHANPRSLYLALAIVGSVVVHILLWQLANRMQMQALDELAPIERPDRRVHVKSVDLRELVRPRLPPQEEIRERILREQEQQLHSLFQKEQLVVPPKPPDLKPQLTGLGRDLLKKVVTVTKPQAGDGGQGVAPRSSPPPEILAIKARELPPQRDLGERSLIPEIDRQLLTGTLISSIATPNPGTGVGSPEGVGLGMRLGLPPRGMSELPPLPAAPVRPVQHPARPVDAQTLTQPANMLDPLLRVSVRTWWEPKGGAGYYEVEINANEQADRLVTIPKDALFLVDSSGSIGFAKLNQFVRGLSLALDYLQPEDRFNVVAFRENPQPLFDTCVPVTAERLDQARGFLRELSSRGKTDVYAGVAPFVTPPRRDETRPLLIFLLTDGRTTTGHELANNEFIRRVTQENRAAASIFSFSAGDNSNLFLMDYLSYKNRGFSLHIAELDGSATELTTYVGGLTDIIVADLACRVTGKLGEEVYPRQLQHLFRGHPLTVYGKVPAGTRELAIQVRGHNREGKDEELIVTADLAKTTAGTADLARRWAAQKIYYLIGEWTIRNDDATRKEIQALAAQYDILIPY